MQASLDIDHLVQTERGLISREIYVSPEFHEQELEKLFSRAWLFVGHESQIPSPGDYSVSHMDGESVIPAVILREKSTSSSTPAATAA